MADKQVTGRPTDYTSEVLDRAQAYADGAWKETGRVIPSLVGLAIYIGRARSTVYKWRDEPDKKRFSDICSQVEELQHEELVNNGLTGDFNSTITKVILTKHGYSDKTEVDQTVKGEMSHQVSYGDAVANALKNKHKD